jgi:hypothetical protein
MKFGKLILEPKSFFRELSSQPANMYIAVSIVILAAYMNTGAAINAGRNIMPANMGLAPILFNLILGGIGSAVIMWFLAWLPIKAFSGIGKRSFEIAAWTIVPQCFNGLFSIIFSFLFPFYIVNPEMTNSGRKVFAENIKSAIPCEIRHILIYLTALWSLYLLYCAIYSFTKDKKKTYLTVGLSLCFFLCTSFLIPVFTKFIR